MITWLTRHIRLIGLLILVSTVVPLRLLPTARVDNSIEIWLAQDSPEYKAYQDFLNKYGNDEFVVIAGQTDQPLSTQALALQRQLTEKLMQIQQVDTVLTLADLAEYLSRRYPDWQRRLESEPLFQNLLLGTDDHDFGIIAVLKRYDRPVERRATVEKIEAAVASVRKEGIALYLAGAPIVNTALDRGSQAAARTILPAAIVVSLILLGLILRSIGSVAAVLCSVSVTVIWTAGLMILAGRTFNMVTVVLPSLLFVLSLAGGVHVTVRYQTLWGAVGKVRRALGDTLAQTVKPVTLSALTTGIGFLSLRMSSMQPVIDFGTFTALGTLLSLVCTLTVLPALLSIMPVHIMTAAPAHHWTARWAAFAARHARLTIAAAIAALVICTTLAARVRAEVDVARFFGPQAPVRKSANFIGRNLTGLYSVELDVTPETIHGKGVIELLDRFSQQVSRNHDVAKVIDYATIARCLQGIPHPAALDLPGTGHNPLRQLQRRFIWTRGSMPSYRISVWVRSMAGADFYRLLAQIDQQAAALFGPVGNYTVTGVVPLLNQAQRSLIQTQIKSFALAGIAVLVLIGVFMRSFRAMVAAVLPNIVPVAALFAVMVLAGIALDGATVMIAGIAIGIAADDTVHFLCRFQREKAQGLSCPEAITVAFNRIGRSITYTTIVAMTGFTILLTAEFKPIQYFGLLSAVTMALAWLGDVCVLPACVTWIRLWGAEQDSGVGIQERT